MAQLFAHYYPDRTAGIVLIDSYPDYLMLEAIAANRSKEWYSGSRGSTISTLKLLRLFETFLFVDLFVGSMGNSSYSSVSASYYRTGYFWDSSYKDYSGQQST
jgi:pimeloyl-ACP methyl ester carboxylesterase